MILIILEFFLLAIILYVLHFLWKYKHLYFGVENRHKYFAEFYADFPEFHNLKTRPQKKKLFENLNSIETRDADLRKKKGIRLLEIGAGTGANFEFYPLNTKLVTVDPNPYFQGYLKKTLEKFPNVTLDSCIVAGAEDMTGIPDHSVDVVVSTLVLCSVPNLQKVFKEIRRVLVPGGKFLFMEHVVDDRMSMIRILQHLGGSLGFFQFLFDGCRPDKDIESEIMKAGFASVDAKRFRLDLTSDVPLWAVYFVEPHFFGVATTSATE